ncbi:hypothetical protein A6B38_00050 [Bartonella bacilliformis]|nr:hypothetical protein A6B38_00050 [Bartonella bacilliformis]
MLYEKCVKTLYEKCVKNMKPAQHIKPNITLLFWRRLYQPQRQAFVPLTLARPKTRVGFIQDINTTFSTNHPVVAVTSLKCLERIFNFHDHHRL